MSEQRNPVVASLASRSQHPYSSIAISPDRKYAVAAGKDTLRLLSISAQGLREIRSLRISQHFQTQVSSIARNQSRYGDVRDAFSMNKANAPQNMASSTSTVVVTDVAWSLPQVDSDPESSLIAAAGSNGVVIVWEVDGDFLEPSTASAMGPPPDEVLSQHSRAVNRLAWHSSGNRIGCLLTASQDATVRLWERKTIALPVNKDQGKQGIKSWFGMQSADEALQNTVTWQCLATFEPKADAIRDIQWSPFHDDVFAMVSDTGALIVYNTCVPSTPWVRIRAHDGEASSVDWHPSRPYTIATGGSSDRTVKVWDLDKAMSLHSNEDKNSNKWSIGSNVSDGSQRSDQGATSAHNDDTIRAKGSSPSGNTWHPSNSTPNSKSSTTGQSTNNMLTMNIHTMNSQTMNPSVRSRSTRPSELRHILYIAASVTRVIWRPSAGPHSGITNTHETMLAVATSPIKGASAGGNGMLSLWSQHRPFMALSVMEGHKEGAVTDFAWLDIPVDESYFAKDQSMLDTSESSRSMRAGTPVNAGDNQFRPAPDLDDTSIIGSSRRKAGASNFASTFASNVSRSRSMSYQGEEKDSENVGESSNSLEGTWQHVLSVGRDGRCVIQSFARGDRPISRTSPSCFSLANLSPFQRGYGSLQVFSVHQNVPNGRHEDYALTGLRQDSATSRAPGVFREPMISASRDGNQGEGGNVTIGNSRIPINSPQLVFNVIDQGDLDDEMKPVEAKSTITVAPEVVHMSRFADAYELYPSEEFPTRAAICLHNASIAQELNCSPLARMWRMIASMLKGAGIDYLPEKSAEASNALQFALVPCMKTLLEERANAGDVQTCVALCEILQVIQLDSDEATTCIPDLQINLVREWYLAYIDLLQQMCLFSHASAVIGRCKDPFVGALNQQSTTIHEACQNCGKALLVGEGENLQDRESSLARRSCNSCRRRVGFCFVCHEPVTGVYVWCPGCGHGGHLDHALDWFGGMAGTPVREVCPTGCGHRCNLSQQLSAFPRTNSFLGGECLPVTEN